MTAIFAAAAETADLVTVVDGQPVTTSDRLAAAAGVQHASLIRLIRRHAADLAAVGNVRIQPPGIDNIVKPVKSG